MINKKTKGIIAAGHPITAKAGKIILEAGGNAYDAVAGAFFAACLAEPSLASLGGGSYLMARNKDGESFLYDFFVQTPKRKKKSSEMDFYPVEVDFGGATQVFHIGMASSAVPGSAKGIFEIQKELGIMPIKKVIEPAVKFAREGIVMNWFSGFAFEILSEIYKSQPETLKIFESHQKEGELLLEGEILKNEELANVLEFLAKKGVDEFYQGEIAIKMTQDMKNKGGLITLDDLKNYQIKKRKPLIIDYRDAEFITNPPPSAGGILISVALKLLEKIDLKNIKYGSEKHLLALILAMKETGIIRKNKIDDNIREKDVIKKVLNDHFLDKSFENISRRVNKWGSTTQISVIDKDGNIASMTTTNGEGSGYLIPGTGSVLNNMLGEEDLNPKGFFEWQENERVSSMMAPSIVVDDKLKIAVGSAGSNRLRSAILQTIISILDFNKDIEKAVNNPRLHFENEKLDIEAGFSNEVVKKIKREFPKANIWKDKNLFFGGANCVMFDEKKREFSGAGDIRRQGVCLLAEG
ncbi:MAG TPA: gamma-glutamyltransferase [Candidatus Moranbacteria bacterium]|nr:gamma-glutamyltransferase [Candidatus Moranbacteria bacterium]